MKVRVLTASLVALLVCGTRADAQRGVRLQPEVRVDAFVARITAVQAGVGLSASAGTNLRLSLVGALGVSNGFGERGLSARVDGIARFLLDPTFSRRWVPYAGGGMSARYDRARDWRGALVLLLGLEGPPGRGVVPFAEAGWGDGFRLGLGLRTSLRDRR